MLKALELFGFKSFADKTRFEFPPGITVVVGPNGSGKSNIVDAIKWVLGEQSAKSLRGKDMADVIFKGAGGTNGRKPMNTAEATIVIDNADARIAIEAAEIHVTRRVYRSGEGEYLINGQSCRLKDIKDLFRGTGAGADAYSLIEQGKIDRMLQASPKDRRAIFEEAAGISRFKAKKIEAQRRLERVDQNLLRLSDIVDEVESRLRSIRSQASKARRYREYSERLQQLRTQVGLTDWRKLTERLNETEAELRQLREQADSVTAQVEFCEARSLEIEVGVGDTNEDIRKCEDRVARNREGIAGHESTITHGRLRLRELADEASRHRANLAAMSNRAGDLQERLRITTAAVQSADGEHQRIVAALDGLEQQLGAATNQLDQLRAKNDERRGRYVESMRLSATLGSQMSSSQSQLETASATIARRGQELDELQAGHDALAAELTEARQHEERLAREAEQAGAALQAGQTALSDGRHELAKCNEALTQLQGRYSGASQRAQVLEDLQKKLEGVGGGVKDVLAAAAQQPDGPFGDVRGLVAELINADIEMAPLVDVALGETAHYVVLAGDRLLDSLETDEISISGRVGFISSDFVKPRESKAGVDLIHKPGVIRRASAAVQVAGEFRPLIDRLLGTTWLVEQLSDARALHKDVGGDLRFVTRNGELLESDGTVIVGPRHAAVGLVSRRSELRFLQSEVAELQEQISDVKSEIADHGQAIAQNEQAVEQLSTQHKQAVAAQLQASIKIRGAEQQFEQLDKQRLAAQSEVQAATEQRDRLTQEVADLGARIGAIDVSVATMEADLANSDQRIVELETQRRQHLQEVTSAKVELAKSEQRLESLRTQMRHIQDDHRERSVTIGQLHVELDGVGNRLQTTEQKILHATSEVAMLYLSKESLAAEAASHLQLRDQLNAERMTLAAEIQKHRKLLRQLEEQHHQVELQSGEIRHERGTLAERLREDYGIELAELTHEPTEDEQQQRDEVEEEIDSLRRKISNIGAVNMEALDELDELESRYAALSGQHQDLTQAKEALERIITKINADSRRLFSETLEAIRTNFQALFRKAFGGGRADIVMEEGVDILEAGVDIIANPPGKPSFNNSLLSGGEKALTAVALLLAIFQFRPSPFCVLDEVDAPFDEANIGRFVDVLTEFLGWTKFVIVTHSKKTMTAATTLYGVTMQESGVSKRVSVQFEDVTEDGHIAPEAIERDDEATDEGDERGAA